MMSTMALRIREPRPDDAEALAMIHVAAWQAGYAGQMPADYLAGLSNDMERRISSWREQRLAEAGVRHLVAEDDESGELYGFIAFGACRDEDVPATTGEIWAINLHPSAWGKGIGSELFQAGVDGLRDEGFQDAVLWVLDTNERARRFYERHGWRADGHTKADDRRTFELHEVRYATRL